MSAEPGGSASASSVRAAAPSSSASPSASSAAPSSSASSSSSSSSPPVSVVVNLPPNCFGIPVEERSLLVIGKTQCGKTTFIRTLTNTGQVHVANIDNRTKEPQPVSMFMQHGSKCFTMRFLDTPGLSEITTTEQQARSDNLLLSIISNAVKRNLVTLNGVIVVHDIGAGFNAHDFDIYQKITRIIPKELYTSTLLVLTNTESLKESVVVEKVNALKLLPQFKPLFDMCRGGDYTVGAINDMMEVDDAAPMIRRINHKMQAIIDKIVMMNDAVTPDVITNHFSKARDACSVM